MTLPRFMHRIYAGVFGYFWKQCPICGRMFGGHEVMEQYYGAIRPRPKYNEEWIVCPGPLCQLICALQRQREGVLTGILAEATEKLEAFEEYHSRPLPSWPRLKFWETKAGKKLTSWLNQPDHGYQPDGPGLDVNNPPKGGSGVPR